jgi:hypothetical protein
MTNQGNSEIAECERLVTMSKGKLVLVSVFSAIGLIIGLALAAEEKNAWLL